MIESASAPFPAGPNVSAYVPNPDVDHSLVYLAAKLTEGPGWVGISGPPGVGKTLMLRLLLRRLGERFTSVYVPSAQLPPDEIGRWVAEQLGAPPDRTFQALARERAAGGRPLLLGIDEAQLAGDGLAAWLEGLCAGETAMRALVAWSEADGLRKPDLSRRCATRVFVEPLDVTQVPAYVSAQLVRAQAPEDLHRLLSGRTLDRIALASGGNQRSIQRLADAELAAWHWRQRAGQPLVVRSAAPAARRATASAPRAAGLAADPPSAPSFLPRGALVLALAAAAILATVAALHRLAG